MKTKKLPLSGGEAISYALKQIDVDVFSMYPITPQTPIIESYSMHIKNKEVKTEQILVESEHSALSAAIGSAASGARSVTATASQGLMYMYEMLSVASGFRLPIVMPVANRTVSAPINIHCDHSDAMACVDQGWMMVFCENAQEAYEMTIFSFRLAEKVFLPIMVCIDGFYTSHNVENLEVYEDLKVKNFVGEYKTPYNLLDTKNPISVGSLALPNTFFEIKKEMFDAFLDVEEKFIEISKDYKKTFGKEIKIFEEYFTKDAEIILVLLSSAAENAKDVIDKFRKQGKKIGLLRPILFRPFIYKEYLKGLKNAKKIIVLDRAEGPGSFPPLYKDIKLTVCDNPKKQEVFSYVFGLGGRDLLQADIENLLNGFLKGKPLKEKYLGIKK
jgi:pyruvate ferredoxin oxidoreductase alpha subunit